MHPRSLWIPPTLRFGHTQNTTLPTLLQLPTWTISWCRAYTLSMIYKVRFVQYHEDTPSHTSCCCLEALQMLLTQRGTAGGRVIQESVRRVWLGNRRSSTACTYNFNVISAHLANLANLANFPCILIECFSICITLTTL